MKTIIAIERIDFIRVDEEGKALHIYLMGREKAVVVDSEDEMYVHYLEQFKKVNNYHRVG